ncbi:MAG: cyclic nucleotide-binding domain-containing protein [Alphaproteobacteria bacterium]|nr:cyclic nucleotide-binding domain-containing protein [Alphaproteobacteria bacterium]
MGLARQSFLRELPQATLEVLLAGAEVRDFGKRELVFREGEPARWLAVLIEGNVQLSGFGHDSREVALEVLQPPAPIAPWAPLTKTPYPASARAVRPARVLLLPAAELRQALAGEPRLGRALIDALAQQAAAYMEQIKHLKLRTTTQRLGCYLLALAEGQGGNPNVVLPHEKQLVASQLGMKPESLSRAFAALQEVDVSMVGSRVHLGDMEKLQNFCRPGT